MKKNLFEKIYFCCFFFSKVNIQAEYQQKSPKINLNGAAVDDDDFIQPEPPPRTDYGKKALVNTFSFVDS